MEHELNTRKYIETKNRLISRLSSKGRMAIEKNKKENYCILKCKTAEYIALFIFFIEEGLAQITVVCPYKSPNISKYSSIKKDDSLYLTAKGLNLDIDEIYDTYIDMLKETGHDEEFISIRRCSKGGRGRTYKDRRKYGS